MENPDELHLRVSLLEAEMKVLAQKLDQNALLISTVKIELVTALGDLRKAVENLIGELNALKLDRARVLGGWWVATKVAAFLSALGTAVWAFVTWVAK